MRLQKARRLKASGDGKIIFRGWKGGYGNTIIVQHGGNVTTLYGHLSRFAGRGYGSRARQGDIIGYVGATGLATAPHLHYEYRKWGPPESSHRDLAKRRTPARTGTHRLSDVCPTSVGTSGQSHQHARLQPEELAAKADPKPLVSQVGYPR